MNDKKEQEKFTKLKYVGVMFKKVQFSGEDIMFVSDITEGEWDFVKE